MNKTARETDLSEYLSTTKDFFYLSVDDVYKLLNGRAWCCDLCANSCKNSPQPPSCSKFKYKVSESYRDKSMRWR